VPLLEQVLEKYPQQVKVAFKNFPLSNHKYAMNAAKAALAAGSRGKFWEVHDLLFKNYNSLDDQKIRDIALGSGLDQTEFDLKMTDPAIQGKINRDIWDGRQAGVRSTPTVYINGRLLKNRSLQGFQAIIDAELQKMNKK
jgi:protein-disulfide isomerase